MEQTKEMYEQLLAEFVRWAEPRQDIRAVFVVGSRARTDHPADEWADLDIAFVVAEPGRYLKSLDWVESIRRSWLTCVQPTEHTGGVTVYALLDGGLNVEFAPLPLDLFRQFKRAGIPPEMADVPRRGVRVVHDKEGWIEKLLLNAQGTKAPFRPPAPSEFLNVVNSFWYNAVLCAKHLKRGELWRAVMECSGTLKWSLLQMMEWHARALTDSSQDVWMNGRFLEEWVDPRVLEGVTATFAHYDKEDVIRALLATLDLFQRLSVEISTERKYPLAQQGTEHALELIRQLF